MILVIKILHGARRERERERKGEGSVEGCRLIKFLGVTSNDRIIRVLKYTLCITQRFAMIIIVPADCRRIIIPYHRPISCISFCTCIYFLFHRGKDRFLFVALYGNVWMEFRRNFVVIYPWIEMKSNVTFEGVTGSRVKCFVSSNCLCVS